MQKAEVRNIGVEASATGRNTSTNTSTYTWASSSRMVLRMVVMLAMLAFFFFTPAAVTAERCFKEVSQLLQEEYIHVFLFLQCFILS